MSLSSHFEYKIRELDYHKDSKDVNNAEAVLDAFGHDGWDLASAVPITENGKTVRILFCLKKLSRRSIL